MAEINDKESNLVDITIGDKNIKQRLLILLKIGKGLMGRESLPENQGMLFIYDEPQDLSYWMKDTLISLDIILQTMIWKQYQLNRDSQCPKSLLLRMTFSMFLK